jgi:hypothetical protein
MSESAVEGRDGDSIESVSEVSTTSIDDGGSLWMECGGGWQLLALFICQLEGCYEFGSGTASVKEAS